MSVAFSQHGTSTHPQVGAPSNGSLTLPSTADGDVILLLVVSTLGALSSVSGCGATWAQLEASAATELWVGVGVVAASGTTISFSNPNNVILDAAAMSFTGATQGVIDSSVVTSPATGATSASVLGSTNKPFETGQAVAAFLVYDAFGNTFASGTPAGGYTDSPSAWTTVDEYAASGNNLDIDTACKITTGAGTYSRQANISSGNTFSNDWMAFTALLSADPFPVAVSHPAVLLGSAPTLL